MSPSLVLLEVATAPAVLTLLTPVLFVRSREPFERLCGQGAPPVCGASGPLCLS